MIYFKTTNKQIAKDFQSLLIANIKNDLWIKEIIVREKIISYKNKRVKNSEWVVEAKLVKDEQLNLFSDLPLYSENQVKKILEKGELIFNQDF